MFRGGFVGVLGLGAVALTAAGCDVFDASLLDGAVADAEPSDGTADGPDGGACALRKPPPPPDIDDSDGEDEVLLVMKDVVLEQGMGKWRDIGFDLDGVCSRAPSPQLSCVPPDGASAEVDGNDGIDNSVGHNLLQLVDIAAGGSLQESSRSAQEVGHGTFMFRVRDWNGEPDDPEVHATFVQGRIGAPPLDDGSAPVVVNNDIGEVFLEDGSEVPTPDWDNEDWFWGRTDNFVAGEPGLPRLEDPDAYVAEGHLVARFNSRVDLAFGGDELGVVVKIQGTVFTVPMVDERPDDPSFGTAVIGARWGVDDLFATAAAVGVCEGTAEYGVLESTLEEAVDTTSDLDAPRDAPCDAVSIGVAAETYRGRWAGILRPESLVDQCEIMGDGGVPDGGLDGG